MKCDKLKRFEIVGKYTDDETIGECYDADEVDAAIAELKEFAEDACLERDDNQTAIDELNAENRKLKRALWIARAERANISQYWGAYVQYVHFHEKSFYEFINDDIFRRDNPNNDSFRIWFHRWQSVERKCRAKAEEYK